MLILEELKWIGINTCVSVDSERVKKRWLLLNGNAGGTEGRRGVLGTTKRAGMTYLGGEESALSLKTHYSTLVNIVKYKQ